MSHFYIHQNETLHIAWFRNGEALNRQNCAISVIDIHEMKYKV